MSTGGASIPANSMFFSTTIETTKGPDVWAAKQALAAPARYYGDGGTIHGSGELDVETDKNGNVVAVWFRCQPLPFRQARVDKARVAEMREMVTRGMPTITGVEVLDPES